MTNNRRVDNRPIRHNEDDGSHADKDFKKVMRKAKKDDSSTDQDSNSFNKQTKKNTTPVNTTDALNKTATNTPKKTEKIPPKNIGLLKLLEEGSQDGLRPNKDISFPSKDKLSKIETADKTIPLAQMQIQPRHYDMACEKLNQIDAFITPKTKVLLTQMVSTIMVMQDKGVTSTHVKLDSEAFKGSKFYGATIELKQFDTATSSFNISLSGNPEQIDLFNKHLPMLSKILKGKEMPFQVGRVETSQRSDFLFRRKSSAGDKSGDTL